MNEIKLKPCPFCGGVAKVEYAGNRVYICCKPCGSRTILCGTVIWAAKCWNYRKGHKTFREHFEENFPFDKFQDGLKENLHLKFCVEDLYGADLMPKPCETYAKCSSKCVDCWDMEMKNADLTHGER